MVYGLDHRESIPDIIQTGPEIQPASCLNGYRDKLPEREADYSPPSSTEVKNGGAIAPGV
jgi:hypothetical protein